jgi:hypothetical protein
MAQLFSELHPTHEFLRSVTAMDWPSLPLPSRAGSTGKLKQLSMPEEALIVALDALQNPPSPHHQANALKILKNELIGNKQRKAAWIDAGIVDILNRILNHKSKDDEEACLQAIIIIGSLAHGIFHPAPSQHR